MNITVAFSLSFDEDQRKLGEKLKDKTVSVGTNIKHEVNYIENKVSETVSKAEEEVRPPPEKPSGGCCTIF